jgi:ABC-type transporter Mla subunit MlaD
MEYKSSEVKAGMFIFFSLLVLIAMIFTLGNLKDMFHEKKKLRILFKFTGGLDIGAPVRYSGLDVGKVVGIELEDAKTDDGLDRVAVLTEIDPTIIVKKNSGASIKTSGLMGGMYIDIRSGTRNAEPLPDGETLVGQESFEFAKIGDMMSEIVLQTSRFIDITDHLVADSRETLKLVQGSIGNFNSTFKRNQPNIQNSIDNFSKVSTELAAILNENGDALRKTIHHVASSTGEIDDILTTQKDDLRKTISHAASGVKGLDHIVTANGKNIETIIAQTLHLTREMESLLADNRPGVTKLISTMETDTHKISSNIDSATGNLEKTLVQGSTMLAENRRDIKELIGNLRATSEDMKSLVAELQRNPWKLVRKSDEPEPIKTPYLPPISGQKELRMQRLDKLSTDN